MSMYDMHSRTKEDVVFSFTRYKVSGVPTCMSWAGDEAHEREACIMLRSVRFGTVYICEYTGEEIHEYPNRQLLKPCSGCPAWSDEDA